MSSKAEDGPLQLETEAANEERQAATREVDQIKGFNERREVLVKKGKAQLKNISKKIKQCIKENQRKNKQGKTVRILGLFKGIKHVASEEKNVPKSHLGSEQWDRNHLWGVKKWDRNMESGRCSNLMFDRSLNIKTP